MRKKAGSGDWEQGYTDFIPVSYPCENLFHDGKQSRIAVIVMIISVHTHTNTHIHSTHTHAHTHTHTHTHAHTHTGSINGAAVVPVEREKGDNERVVTRVDKFGGHTWCFCNWLLTCFKKEEPAIGATNYEGETPPTPEVRPRPFNQSFSAQLSTCIRKYLSV